MAEQTHTEISSSSAEKAPLLILKTPGSDSTNSMYEGVRSRPSGNGLKWCARIKRNGVRDNLGVFSTEIEAATAYAIAHAEYESSLIAPPCTPINGPRPVRAVTELDVSSLMVHPGMNESIAEEFLSSALAETPVLLRNGSIFYGEKLFEDFETPEKLSCPRNQRQLLQPAVDEIFPPSARTQMANSKQSKFRYMSKYRKLKS